MHRDYDLMTRTVQRFVAPGRKPTRDERLDACVEALWHSLHAADVSWVGFYLDQPDHADERRLVLGTCRDKPACSPIGLHGVCGQALLSKTVRIVDDVRDLGPNYIACDPRDRSEIVVPLIDSSGRCWAVLDLDSHQPRAFDESDAVGLDSVLRAAGLHSGPRLGITRTSSAPAAGAPQHKRKRPAH